MVSLVALSSWISFFKWPWCVISRRLLYKWGNLYGATLFLLLFNLWQVHADLALDVAIITWQDVFVNSYIERLSVVDFNESPCFLKMHPYWVRVISSLRSATHFVPFIVCGSLRLELLFCFWQIVFIYRHSLKVYRSKYVNHLLMGILDGPIELLTKSFFKRCLVIKAYYFILCFVSCKVKALLPFLQEKHFGGDHEMPKGVSSWWYLVLCLFQGGLFTQLLLSRHRNIIN